VSSRRRIRCAHVSAHNGGHDWLEIGGKGTVAIAALAVVGSTGTAEAQSSLSAVHDRLHPSPARNPPKPQLTAEQLPRARRRPPRRQAEAGRPRRLPPAGPSPEGAQPPGRQSLRESDSPYKADRLASPNSTEPLANQPRTVTVLTKETPGPTRMPSTLK